MKTPEVFLAYAPRGAGLRCALAYLESDRDVYGWYCGPCDDASVARRYFLIEDFHAAKPSRYDTVEEADLHSDWSLDEARRHELTALQEAFSREWLLFRDQPGAALESLAYSGAELAAGEVNVRFARLSKFSTLQPNWTFYSPKFERGVLRYLSTRWPLEFRVRGDTALTA